MIIIELSGGLGNQMFQLCLYMKMAEMGKEVFLDDSCYSYDGNYRPFELDVFPNVRNASINYTNSKKAKNSFGFNCKRSIIKRFGKVYKDKIGIYQPEVFDMDWARLEGYWQNEAYFSDIRNKVLNLFSFDWNAIGNDNVEMAQEMEKGQSVSVHVRRGDYLDQKFSAVYSGICSERYYQNAVKYVCAKIREPIFYVFSDDMEWVKENIQFLFGERYDCERICYVEENTGDRSYVDMFLMSQCRHHVIANSTFSWWGAWLGTNEDKIVVAPNGWFANHDVTDTICEGWIRISGEK